MTETKEIAPTILKMKCIYTFCPKVNRFGYIWVPVNPYQAFFEAPENKFSENKIKIKR